MFNLEALFVDVDDFCQQFVPEWEKFLIESGEKQRKCQCSLSMSEVMTILILFHIDAPQNNNERTHQGKMCCGRTPLETLIDGKSVWVEKNLAQI